MNWLENVDEEIMTECIDKYYDVLRCNSVRKKTDPNYGPYFVLCGWANGPRKYANLIYFGQYGPLCNKGRDLGFFENLTPESKEDFNALLFAKGGVRESYLKWIEIVSKSNEGITNENGLSYIQCLKENIGQFIEDSKQNLDKNVDETINERKRAASILFDELAERGVVDQEMDRLEDDTPSL